MNPVVLEEKRAMRSRVRELQKLASLQSIAEDSRRLCERFRDESLWQSARCLLFFCPMPQEPDIQPLMAVAFSRGAEVAVPRFDVTRKDYDVCLISSPDDLRTGQFGILEPRPDCAAISLNRLDFAFVPGLAFDHVGRRLGRGKGFFDRLLARIEGHKCGVAFDWQVMAAVPVEPHDIRVDSLLTPTRWIHCVH